MLLSATLRARESAFNALRVQPGQLVEVETFRQDFGSKYVRAAAGDTQSALEIVYACLKTGQVRLPAVVFLDSLETLSDVVMGLLKLYQNEDWEFDVLVDGWREVQSPLLNVNRAGLSANTVVFTLDDHARGVDLPEI